MRLKYLFLFLILFTTLLFVGDAFAVPFSELNPELVKGCIGCRYYSVLYDSVSQGGYRVYTGLFNICMFFLAVAFSFDIMQKLFKILVSNLTGIDGGKISDETIIGFWKDIFKTVIKISMVIILVFTADPKSVTRYTIDPIISGGIAVSRVFINYGIDQLQNGFGQGSAQLDNKLIPEGTVAKVKLGIFTLPLYDVNSPIKRIDYCSGTAKRNSDAEKYEKKDAENNLPNALPLGTKLDLMCLMREVSILSFRYAGLATYYMLYTFDKNLIQHELKKESGDGGNSVSIDKISKKEFKQKEEEVQNKLTGNNFMWWILTAVFAVWLVSIGFSLYGLLSWFNLGMIGVIISISIPVVLLLLYFFFGGPALIMTLTYYVVYLLLILLMPFYFIQPMFKISIMIFAIPLMATAWALGKKEYISKAIGVIVSSAIGMAVLCMLFVICVFFNEITFYSLYGNWLTMDNMYKSVANGQEFIDTLNLYNFLIMSMMNLLSLHMLSKYSVVVSLFVGDVGNEFFGFLKDTFKGFESKIMDTTKFVVGQEKERSKKEDK